MSKEMWYLKKIVNKENNKNIFGDLINKVDNYNENLNHKGLMEISSNYRDQNSNLTIRR